MTDLLSSQGDNIAVAKETFRREMRPYRYAASRLIRQTAAHQAMQHFITLPEVRNARVVALYAPIDSELDTGPIAKYLFDNDILVVYPKVAADRLELQFHRVETLEQLHPGRFGVHEPESGTGIVSIDKVDVVIVPGLAFDKSGRRLGWGCGYYDATLADYSGLRVGFGYEFQMIDTVPVTTHDLLVDMIVTDRGCHKVVRPATQGNR